jgi:hypothetical protein
MQGQRVMGNALNCTNMGLERDKLHLNFYEHFLNIGVTYQLMSGAAHPRGIRDARQE